MRYLTDEKGNRIGLIHYIYRGDKTIDFTFDKNGKPYVKKADREKAIKKFESLENLAYEYISNLQKEFYSWLDENELESSMGTIDYKQDNKK